MLGEITLWDGEKYTLSSMPYEEISYAELGELMAFDKYPRVTLKGEGLETVYSGLYFIFDDTKVLRSRNIEKFAYEISDQLYDAVKLAKHIYKTFKPTDEQLNKKPIVVVPYYYSNKYGFNINEPLVKTVLSQSGKNEYTALAINLTPCADAMFTPYFDDFDNAKEILRNAHETSISKGYQEMDGDPTEFATARYVVKTNQMIQYV